MTNQDTTSIDELIDEIIEMWDFSPFQDEDSRIERVHKEIKTLISDQVAKARIQTLTDVDNLNLLNDSDEWHKFYTSELATLNGVKK